MTKKYTCLSSRVVENYKSHDQSDLFPGAQSTANQILMRNQSGGGEFLPFHKILALGVGFFKFITLRKDGLDSKVRQEADQTRERRRKLEEKVLAFSILQVLE